MRFAVSKRIQSRFEYFLYSWINLARIVIADDWKITKLNKHVQVKSWVSSPFILSLIGLYDCNLKQILSIKTIVVVSQSHGNMVTKSNKRTLSCKISPFLDTTRKKVCSSLSITKFKYSMTQKHIWNVNFETQNKTHSKAYFLFNLIPLFKH